MIKGDRFLATVQLPNVRFFQRPHWNPVEEINICVSEAVPKELRPHHLMEAELDFYPSTSQVRPILRMQLQQLSVLFFVGKLHSEEIRTLTYQQAFIKNV